VVPVRVPTLKRAAISGGVFVTALILLGLAGSYRAAGQDGRRAAPPATPPSAASTETGQGFLYGRVSTDDGATYQGRLRFGGNQEAFWGNYFNGFKHQNPWARHAPPERLTQKRAPIEIFGFEFFGGERQINLGRPMMARFGDIARIEARGRDLRVTLKSGTVFPLDRYAADDYADGLRVWDGTRGVVNLDEWRILSLEFLPTPGREAGPGQLHGTVRTAHGDFTGFIQWDREECVVSDLLVGRTAGGEVRVPFATIRSIARRSRDSAVVSLLDGRDIVLDPRQGDSHRGIYVDDRRYGRVLVSWNAVERLDFSAGGSGPAYTAFPPGQAITGSVITRAGRRLTGRLVYDLDESETTETLDAPSQGVDFTIPFGMIASIARGGDERGSQPARVTLHDRQSLELERTGDLGDGNAGLLIFVNGQQRAEYVPWAEVQQIDLDRPTAMYPPLAAR
jgi:hypothetical protein